MSACENLPQELIMAFVDDIKDDKKSLKAFSLVCKAWTNPARDHLFASLNIDGFEELDKIKAANIMSTYTPFLRHLRLNFQGHHERFWHELIPFIADFSAPRIQSLAVSDFAWHSLSPNERSAFIRVFESIISLNFSLYPQNSPIDIATIICSFPQLQSLLLLPSLNARALSGPLPLPLQLRLPERLSALHIGYFYQNYRLVLEWLGSISEHSICTLDLYMRWLLPQDLDTVNNLLKALGPSLELFYCDCRQGLSIDLSYNTRLRCIHFRFEQLEKFSTYVSFAMSTLSRIGSRQLEQIIFRFNDFSWRDGEIPDKVDAILDGPQFAALNDVLICAPSDLSALFAIFLPTCHARGIISFVDPASL